MGRRGRYRNESPRPRQCEWCHTLFTPGRSHAKTCSEKCRKARSRAGKGSFPIGNDSEEELDAVFKRKTRTSALCWRILGVAPGDKQHLLKAYRSFSLREHPDRGGDLRTFQRGQAAYSHLFACLR